MSAQPEALRLADVSRLSRHHEWHLQVDDELRRLHAENEALRNVANRGGHIAVAMSRIDQLEAQRDALLEALKEIVDAADGTGWDQLDASFSKARAAIKAAEGK